MTGVKLAKAFGVLLMVVIVCSKQIPEEQHSTYPATDEAHFTSHEYHDEHVLNAGERLIRAAARPLEYPAGTTNNNKQVTFHMNYDAQIADRNQLRRDERTDLDRFMGSITANQVFTQNAGTLGNSPARNFRLDMQGMVRIRGQDYHNLQVQRNGVTRSKKVPTTTYANVLVPRNANGLLTNKVVRRAFYDSSNGSAAVRLEIGNRVVQPRRPV
jgi:hypothetical protein